MAQVTLHHRVRGHGAPLLCIMGWRANLDWWPEPFLARLEARRTLVLFDNRGAGRTGDPGGLFTMAQMADDAADLLDRLGLARADVLGVSMGGMIAQELVLRHPERVQRLVLASTHCGRRSGVRAHPEARRTTWRILREPRKIERHLGQLLFSRRLGRADRELIAELDRVRRIAPISEWASLKQYLAILGHDTRRRLDRIRAPSLILAGERDLMVPADNARVLADSIPGARLRIVPGASHALLHEHAAELAEIVGDFIDEAV
jgi:pimeloyl-ACP methyl ester carboxylesterase